jgi:hypothetical protein
VFLINPPDVVIAVGHRLHHISAVAETNSMTHNDSFPPATNVATSDAPIFASVNELIAAAANQLAIEIAAMKLGLTNANFPAGR